ncbi:class D beta-lactamase [Limoniibacter endophyticus]|uniref:Beta-lactamase n=1 Tax=Limoniibacter endophyticus TaxID=1565040 RepID=A0A8J3DQ02_9HYPH|nr:class D beta-lactamase [Limoniibacter endophyticus]GHC65205.1 beta-lactamase [Limoniibacter endophyticus]
MRILFSTAAVLLATAFHAKAAHICTIIADVADDSIVAQTGDCNTQVTPASTFKVPLALIGFDSGFLTSEHEPVLSPEKGDPGYGGDAWRRENDPKSWLEFSVVWYSQRITRELGAERLTQYLRAWNYGNTDFSGDQGKDNGLERAWIASSLKVSPKEQVRFLGALVRNELKATPEAMVQTRNIMQQWDSADGWTIKGKTGMAYPRKPDYSFDYARAYGWFVGWAEKDGKTYTFARLLQNDKKDQPTPSNVARGEILRDFSKLLTTN